MRSTGQVADNQAPLYTTNDVEQLAQRSSMANGRNQSDIKQVTIDPPNLTGSRNLQSPPTDLRTQNGQSIPAFIQKGHSNGVEMSTQREGPRNTTNGVGKSHCSSRMPNDGHKVALQAPTNSMFLKEVDFGTWTYALPALAAGLCFAGSLFGEFVHDDIWAILNNPDSRGESNLSSVFRNDFWGKAMNDNTSHKSYRPLCVLSFRYPGGA